MPENLHVAMDSIFFISGTPEIVQIALTHFVLSSLHSEWLKNKFCSEAFHISNNNYVHFFSLNGIATIFHFSTTSVFQLDQFQHRELCLNFTYNIVTLSIVCLEMCQNTVLFSSGLGVLSFCQYDWIFIVSVLEKLPV